MTAEVCGRPGFHSVPVPYTLMMMMMMMMMMMVSKLDRSAQKEARVNKILLKGYP